jgi:excinuclease ABC subunit A
MARPSNAPVPPTAPIGEVSAAAAGCIRLRGVRQNNLKNIDLDLPLRELIVITGLSGSGKSSLAFETLYAEGQRRYIETFTPYARQFFDRMDKPAADRIENIPPAIAIEQRNTVRTTRSTIGTMTEICDHMKVLWPNLAKLHCPGCGSAVHKEPPQFVWETLSNSRPGSEALITFDLPLSAKLPLHEQLTLLTQQGFQRVLAGDRVVRCDEFPTSSTLPDRLTVVSDRVRLNAENRSRFIEACEQAYRFGGGRLAVRSIESDGGRSGSGAPRWFSSGFHCAACDRNFREPTASLFSFNNPVGACPHCKGFGRVIGIDPNLALPDRSKTLAEGVVKPWQTATGKECQDDMTRAAKRAGIPMHVPFDQMSEAHQKWLMEGDPGYDSEDPKKSWPKLWYGVRGYFRWLESKAYKMHVRVLLSRYRSYSLCPECHGRRFNADSLAFRAPLTDLPEVLRTRVLNLAGSDRAHRESNLVLTDAPAAGLYGGFAGQPQMLTLSAFYSLPIRDALALVQRWAASLGWTANHPLALVLEEVESRLGYLVEVGLGYLTLDRTTRTLSGGETERVNLTTCVGTRLVNTLFVLDEPSVGLHPRDTGRLIKILERLRDCGNTVVVVEHEPAVMRAANHLVDLGPGHGDSGGSVVFQGNSAQLAKAEGSLTAEYLTGRRTIPVPRRRPVTLGSGNSATPHLELQHASAHNLRDVTVQIPLGRLVCVSGVSGSGKSTLIREVLVPLLQSKLSGTTGSAGLEDEVDDESMESARSAVESASLQIRGELGGVVLVDQSPVGRTPRSNPAVYTGAFDDIRDFFATQPAAKSAGLAANAFSFNSAIGQCQRCRGAGFEKIEMQFLSDIFIRCPECNGRRYRGPILEIRLEEPNPAEGQSPRLWNIADLLEAPVETAMAFLQKFPESKPARRAVERLKLLCDVGLGYLHLGQPVNTLSGGESQRLKLVRHLAEAPAGNQRTLFLFDEPTTGLHFEDVRVLLQVFQRLVDAGNTVLVIEHNLDVIRAADWVIDLGPEAGDEGGQVVAAGSPETVARCDRSHTGRYLRGDS